MHQERDLVAADQHAAAEAQLRGDPRRAVGAARCRVDLSDEIRQPGVADRPRRQRPVLQLVTGDLGRLMPDATQVSCSAFGQEVVDRL